MHSLTQLLVRAVRASMAVVHSAQGTHVHSALKGDGTSVTVTDKKSEAAGYAVLRDSGFTLNMEERGRIEVVGDGEFEILYDPLDGTRPFANGGMTSTVIAALYNKRRKAVVAVVIGEPSTGRIWLAEEGQGTVTDVQLGIPCSVWDGKLNPKSTVFIDLYPGFRKEEFQALSDEECAQIFLSIYGKKSAIAMLGSNGLHHALVANGGEGVAGSITTALGGPWDVAGTLLVKEAGGHARAFAAVAGGFEERDPLDVKSYHFLVTGNSVGTVDALSACLINLRKQP